MYIGGWFFCSIGLKSNSVRLIVWPRDQILCPHIWTILPTRVMCFSSFIEFRFRGFFSDDKDRKMSVFEQTEFLFNLLIMPRVDCGGSVVLDNFRLFIKRGKISGNAQNWCQTFWIFVRFWWKKTLSGETFNVTSFPRFLVFVILSLNNARFCLWFHLIKSIKF